MIGQWCEYNPNLFCQERCACSGCEIYLRRDSNSQETNKNAVLQSVIPPNLPFSSDALQTQAGVDTTYPPLITTPACKFTPLAQCSRAKDGFGLCVVGSNPTGRIPVSLIHSFLPDKGAGNFFNTTNPLSLRPLYSFKRKSWLSYRGFSLAPPRPSRP